MSLFRRILRSLSSGTNVQTPGSQPSHSVDGTTVSREASGAVDCSASTSAVDPAAMPLAQSDSCEDNAGDRQAVDSMACEDESLSSQIDNDGRLYNSEDSNGDDAVRMDEFQSEADCQDEVDMSAGDLSTSDLGDESISVNSDGDYQMPDAEHVYLQDQPEAGFDDMCQLPPAQQEAEFWDQTVDDPANQDVDRGN